jgi:hypothetical protein
MITDHKHIDDMTQEEFEVYMSLDDPIDTAPPLSAPLVEISSEITAEEPDAELRAKIAAAGE